MLINIDIIKLDLSYNYAYMLYILLSGISTCPSRILKMLGLYLYTLKICHESCNMLCILNNLLLQKKLPMLWQIICFWTKKIKTYQQQNKKFKPKKNLAGARNWTENLLHPKRMRYHCTTESTENIDCCPAI